VRPPSIVLVSAVAARGLDDDEAPLVEALTRAGAEVRVEAWDDPEVDWGRVDLAVVRSTWDYATRRDDFLAWARRVSVVTRLEHPADVLTWNTDKRYLAELAGLGVATVPTVFVAPGDRRPNGLAGEVVVKPTVGAGSRLAARFPSIDASALVEHLALIHAEGLTAMVQPYRRRVDDEGETAVVCFGGVRSHSIAKAPILLPDGTVSDALFAPEQISPRAAAADEVELADRVLAALPSTCVGAALAPPLYCRIDLVRDDDGRPEVLEVELAEPSVFLPHASGAEERFAAAVIDRLGRSLR
jgi:O-ureido-D-serine cyclo-ligase